MAAHFKHHPDVQLEIMNGGLGELTVSIDGAKVFEGNRLWYPTPGGVIKKVQAALDRLSETPAHQ